MPRPLDLRVDSSEVTQNSIRKNEADPMGPGGVVRREAGGANEQDGLYSVGNRCRDDWASAGAQPHQTEIETTRDSRFIGFELSPPDEFESEYTGPGRGSCCRTRQPGALIVFEDGQIKFFRGDEEVAGFPIAPPVQYQRLKVLGHAAFGVVIQVYRSDLLPDERRAWLKETDAHLLAVQGELPVGFPADLESAQSQLIERTRSLSAQHT